MNTAAAAIRAISGVYFRRLVWWVAVATTVIVLGLTALTIYGMTTSTPAWGLLFVILIPFAFVAMVLIGGLWRASTAILPRSLSHAERQRITIFGRKVFGLVERGRTPSPIALIVIGKDVLRRRHSQYLQSVIDDSSGLRDDFARIRQMFEA